MCPHCHLFSKTKVYNPTTKKWRPKVKKIYTYPPYKRKTKEYVPRREARDERQELHKTNNIWRNEIYNIEEVFLED